MNRISVSQLVSHLPDLTRRAVLSSEQAMLEHLRGLWKSDSSSRALLEGAALKHQRGDRLLVDVEAGAYACLSVHLRSSYVDTEHLPF